MDNEKLILAAKAHFAIRNDIKTDEVEVKISGKNQYGNVYLVRYLGREKMIEGMDEYFETIFKALYSAASE